MNILMLGWELPPHNSGGLGVACYHLAKALASEGCDIDFVVPYEAVHPSSDFMTIHAATKQSPLRRNGLEAYDSRSYGGNDQNGDEPLPPQTIRDVQKEYTTYVERLVSTRHFDFVHAHDWLTIEAGLRVKEVTGAPLIVHVHATEFDRSGEHSGNPIVHEIEYQGLMMADRILAVSAITKRIIVEKYDIPADKIEVVHNAIDAGSFDDHAYDSRTYKYLETLKSEGYTVVTTITRFTVQKGLTYLMHAAARACEKYDKLVFLFAGDGEQRNELIALAADKGISDKVFFTGFIRGRQWRDAYLVGDAFVMSSVSEPFGLTALEAAHHNNALIITKQSGVCEVLSHILRYDYWDVDKLADQMVSIATSPALSSNLRDNVLKEYAQLSWNDIAKKCIRNYDSSISGYVGIPA